jgi:hypothetical protein
MALLIAVRPIDLAILGTLGTLWLGGALFIYVLYRWIIRYERERGGGDPTGIATIEAQDAVDAAKGRAQRRASERTGGTPTPEPALSAHA